MQCYRTLLIILMLGSAAMLQGVRAMELQGHRGARGVLPENSLPSFQNAIAAGADCLELDIAMSADKQLVITHDPALNPDITRQGKGWIAERLPIKSLTVAQLKSYDVGRLRPGSKYAKRFPQQKPIDGLQMPLLAELFNLPEVLANKSLCLDIEIKTTPTDEEITLPPAVIADALVKLIDKSELRLRTRIRSFDWRGLIHVRKIAPDIPLAFLTAQRRWLNNLEVGLPGKSAWLGGLDIDKFEGSAARAVHHLGGQIWAPYYRDLSKPELDLAHQLGLRVIVWTVNDETTIRQLVRMGVDGITTDYPEIGRRVIDEVTVGRR